MRTRKNQQDEKKPSPQWELAPAPLPEPLATAPVCSWAPSVLWMTVWGLATHLSSPGLCKGLERRNDLHQLWIHSGAGQCQALGKCSANIPLVEFISWAPQAIANHFPASLVDSDGLMFSYHFLSTCPPPWNDPDPFTHISPFFLPTLCQVWTILLPISRKKR